MGHLFFFQFCSTSIAAVIRSTFKILNFLFVILGFIVFSPRKQNHVEEGTQQIPQYHQYFTPVWVTQPTLPDHLQICAQLALDLPALIVMSNSHFVKSIWCPLIPAYYFILNKFPSSFSDVFSHILYNICPLIIFNISLKDLLPYLSEIILQESPVVC